MCTKFHLKMWRSTLQTGKFIYNLVQGYYIAAYYLSDVIKHTAASAHSLCCRSFSVLVKDLDGKNHQMTVLNLLYPIDEKDSYKKVNKAYSSVKAIDCVL